MNPPHPPQPHTGFRSDILQLVGIVLMPIGWICFFAGIVAVVAGNIWLWALLFASTLVFNILGRYLYRRGKQMEPRALNQDLNALQQQGNVQQSFLHFMPYTLYLRAFGIEEETNHTSILVAQGPTFSFVGQEEAVAQAVQGIAPGVAIGQPGDKYPPRGMRRLYVQSNGKQGADEWQKLVIEGMKHASLVVMWAPEQGDAGAGLWWEVQQAGKYVRPERFIVLLPFSSSEEDRRFADWKSTYNGFRKEAEKYWPCSLPDYHGIRTARGGSITGVLYFSPDWTPHIVSLASIRIPPLRVRANQLAPAMKIALKPVYEQLGIRWTPPPLTEWIIIAICLLLAPFLLMAVMGTIITLLPK